MNEWEARQVFSNRIPYEIVICFVGSPAIQGNTKRNPYNFHHHNMKCVQLGVEKYQTIEYTPNFSIYHCATEYNALYDKEEPFVPHGNIVKRRDYHNGNAIFRFPLAPTTYERLARAKKGQTSLKFKMSKSTEKETITVIVYGCFHDYILLDDDNKLQLGEE